MSFITCNRAGALLLRRAAGLGEGERLWLEEHLEDCAECARAATGLDLVSRSVRASDQALPKVARDRAMARAFAAGTIAAGSIVPAEERPVPAPLWVWLAAATGVAALIAVGVTEVSRDEKLEPATPMGAPWPTESATDGASIRALSSTPTAPDVVAAPVAYLVEGVARTGDQKLAPQATWSEGSTLRGERGAVIAVAHARVRCEEPCEISYGVHGRVLDLRAGALHVEVDPSFHAPFRVTATDLTVDVLGTIFEVDPTSVSVARGRVRVTSGRAGSERSVEVAAGEKWRAENAPSVSDLLASARRELAGGRVVRAHDIAADARSRARTATERAEAETLLAECDLVGGDREAAARQYTDVARKYEGMPAGESALFAAARATQSSGDAPAARKLLGEYLTKYPSGRYAPEAKRRLNELSSSQRGGR